jgi:AraC-like DNA-binding protein
MTVLASLTRAVAEAAAPDPAQRAALLASAGLDDAALADPEARIPRDLDRLVWRGAATLAGPGFGLRLVESDALKGAFGLLGYLAMTSRTVGEAIERSVRYHRIIKEGTDSQLLSAEGSVSVLETIPGPMDPGAIATAECAAASYVVLARRWAAGPVVPLEVRFQHERPAHLSAYEALFQSPLRFGQKAVAVVFSRETMALPLRTSQPEVSAYLEALARKSLSKLPGDDVASAVREAVRALLTEGDVSLSRVARALGVSPRTLQRRLEERGVEYQRLVDDIRCREALRLVGASDTPLVEIGFQLGYSDPKAFRRAFRRWTGVSPAELRRGRDGASGARAAEVWSS